MDKPLIATAALLLLSAVALAGCETSGPSCCTLRKFCNSCDTCTTDQTETSRKGDEVACEAIVQKFKNDAQYCHPENAPPQHTIEEFAEQCEM